MKIFNSSVWGRGMEEMFKWKGGESDDGLIGGVEGGARFGVELAHCY